MDFSNGPVVAWTTALLSHPARDAWILALQKNICYLLNLSHPARDAWILAANYSSGVPQIEVASRKGCVDLSIKYDFINFEFDSRIPQGMRGFENM